MEQASSRPVSEMDRSEADEMRDAETLAGLANAPSVGASAGNGERPSSSGPKRKTKVHLGYFRVCHSERLQLGWVLAKVGVRVP